MTIASFEIRIISRFCYEKDYSFMHPCNLNLKAILKVYFSPLSKTHPVSIGLLWIQEDEGHVLFVHIRTTYIIPLTRTPGITMHENIIHLLNEWWVVFLYIVNEGQYRLNK